LGWTTWLGERTDDTDANDLILDAFGWVCKKDGETSKKTYGH
jgi:hypothetical protein